MDQTLTMLCTDILCPILHELVIQRVFSQMSTLNQCHLTGFFWIRKSGSERGQSFIWYNETPQGDV